MQLENITQVTFNKTQAYQLLKLRSSQIQSKLEGLQYPQNCNKARKVVAKVMGECGFGCQLHYLAYCQMKAFYANRTLIYKTLPSIRTGFENFKAILNSNTNCSLDDDQGPNEGKCL